MPEEDFSGRALRVAVQLSIAIFIFGILIALSACGGGSPTYQQDAGYESDSGLSMEDAGDAGVLLSDAQVDAGTDARVDLSDAGVDAGNDAGTDAAVDLDAGVEVDAGSDAGMVAVDAGYTRPVEPGRPVSISSAYCALTGDSPYQVWCWNRWADASEIRYLGSGYQWLTGSCALTSSNVVHCFDFDTLSGVAVLNAGAPVVADVSSVPIAEGSTLDAGCAQTSSGVLCWKDGRTFDLQLPPVGTPALSIVGWSSRADFCVRIGAQHWCRPWDVETWEPRFSAAPGHVPYSYGESFCSKSSSEARCASVATHTCPYDQGCSGGITASYGCGHIGRRIVCSPPSSPFSSVIVETLPTDGSSLRLRAMDDAAENLFCGVRLDDPTWGVRCYRVSASGVTREDPGW